jgi:hypothetical protein
MMLHVQKCYRLLNYHPNAASHHLNAASLEKHPIFQQYRKSSSATTLVDLYRTKLSANRNPVTLEYVTADAIAGTIFSTLS